MLRFITYMFFKYRSDSDSAPESESESKPQLRKLPKSESMSDRLHAVRSRSLRSTNPARKLGQVFTYAHFLSKNEQEIYAYNVTGNLKFQLLHFCWSGRFFLCKKWDLANVKWRRYSHSLSSSLTSGEKIDSAFTFFVVGAILQDLHFCFSGYLKFTINGKRITLNSNECFRMGWFKFKVN